MRDLDAAEVDIACLSGNCRNVKEAQLFDDETAKWVKANPDRFIGFAHYPPTGGEEAIEEVDRAVKDLGFKACHIRSLNLQPTEDESKNSILMDDSAMYPLYKKLVELDIPLFIHPPYWPLVPYAFPEPLRKKLRAFRSMGALSREIDLMLTVISLVDGGVLEKFPSLKVVISHLGGGISADWNRAWDVTWGSNSEEQRKAKEKSQKLFRRLYLDTGGIYGDTVHIKLALTKTTPDKILFGTDYPAEVQDPKNIARFIKDIKKLDISDKDKQLILGGNAAALLKI